MKHCILEKCDLEQHIYFEKARDLIDHIVYFLPNRDYDKITAKLNSHSGKV